MSNAPSKYGESSYLADDRIGALVFQNSGADYGVPVDCVVEILRAVAITELPGCPDVVEGLVDVRGELVPVVDLRRRLGGQPRHTLPSDHFVVVRTSRRVLALHIERVERLVQYTPEDFEDGARIGVESTYVDGVIKLAGGLVLIHDVEAFLTAAESDELVRALADRGGAT